LVLAVFLFASPDIKERIYSMVDPYHPNNVTRLHMWETGLSMFLDHPIVGIGDIGTEQLWDWYAQPGWQPEGHLHNNLLMWLVTLGIVGFFALVALFVKIWMVIARIERSARGDWFRGSLALGGLAVLAGFHVNGLFEWNFGDMEIIMLVWAVVGLVLASEKVSHSEAKS
ncbi:MAG: O-antigen ligase family protein, partial [Ignavibacteria bacterium]|nr:O-antigen ligase family protein [Ignavibacteria bacterium]